MHQQLNITFKIAFEHVEKLLDRRQSTTSFYFSVNTAITAVIGLLVKDSGISGGWLTVAIVILLVAGLIACGIWRSLLRQYEILLDWWYARLRELEADLPEDAPKLVTREYDELYLNVQDPSRKIGLTKRESALNWVFTFLYSIFLLGILVSYLLPFLGF